MGEQRDQPRDEVIQELFEQVRKIVDLAEHLFLHSNQQPVARHQEEPPERDEPAPATAAPAHTERLAYALERRRDLGGRREAVRYSRTTAVMSISSSIVGLASPLITRKVLAGIGLLP